MVGAYAGASRAATYGDVRRANQAAYFGRGHHEGERAMPTRPTPDERSEARGNKRNSDDRERHDHAFNT
jgi:hypothetical protein